MLSLPDCLKIMPISDEFSLIEQYFKSNMMAQETSHADVLRSIGDDCAILAPKENYQLVLSMDTLVSGVHFPENTAAYDIAYKALAVNLSDLAAMGAKPAWFTLALSLPHSDSTWLEEFSQGLFALANKYQIQLIGGDTTRSKILSISIQVHGYVKPNQALLRSNAKAGELIAISGALGAPALGLALALDRGKESDKDLSKKDKAQALVALNRPEPQIELGQRLADYSQCAIDISDGLISDLAHIIKASRCGARIDLAQLPIAECCQNLPADTALNYALSAGDEYQLCFSLSKQKHQALRKEYPELAYFIIGEFTHAAAIELNYEGTAYTPLAEFQGYNHFKESIHE